jgi:hypothetical protein
MLVLLTHPVMPNMVEVVGPEKVIQTQALWEVVQFTVVVEEGLVGGLVVEQIMTPRLHHLEAHQERILRAVVVPEEPQVYPQLQELPGRMEIQ